MLARRHLLGWRGNTGECVLQTPSPPPERNMFEKKKNKQSCWSCLDPGLPCQHDAAAESCCAVVSLGLAVAGDVWLPGLVDFITAPRRAAPLHTAASVPAPALRRPPQVRLPSDSIGSFRRRQNGPQTLCDTTKTGGKKNPSGAHSQV